MIATGMLIVGLAVIGAQVQDAETALRKMERRVRAMMLAESQLAELDLGLVRLDTLDTAQEGDFGPRYPDFGWLVTVDRAAIEGMYSLRVDVLHHLRAGDYQPNSFEFNLAETIFTVHALRVLPQPIDLAADFGLAEDEVVDLSDQLSQLGIPGVDVNSFDPRALADLDYEQLLKVLATLSNVPGFDIEYLKTLVPPEYLDILNKSGVLGDEGAGGAGDAAGGDQGGGK